MLAADDRRLQGFTDSGPFIAHHSHQTGRSRYSSVRPWSTDRGGGVMTASLLLLFGSAFLAATILPASSEVLLFVLLREGGDALTLVLVATLGNTLGSLVNWLLGRFLLRFRHRRWFYFSERQIDTAQQWFRRRGQWSLLLAWMPVVGDPLTLIAGIMNVRIVPFLLLVGTGKALRYLVVVFFADWIP